MRYFCKCVKCAKTLTTRFLTPGLKPPEHSCTCTEKLSVGYRRSIIQKSYHGLRTSSCTVNSVFHRRTPHPNEQENINTCVTEEDAKKRRNEVQKLWRRLACAKHWQYTDSPLLNYQKLAQTELKTVAINYLDLLVAQVDVSLLLLWEPVKNKVPQPGPCTNTNFIDGSNA